jgi:hypothetical protein
MFELSQLLRRGATARWTPLGISGPCRRDGFERLAVYDGDQVHVVETHAHEQA